MITHQRLLRNCLAAILIFFFLFGFTHYQLVSDSTPFPVPASPQSPLSPLSSKPQSSAMSVVHTVLFQFKASADPEKVKETVRHFLSLKTACVSATTNQPYILSLKGGKDNSPEGLQGGVTHGFVAEFASTADRDYYVAKDPAHLAFVASLDGLVEKAVVVDFSDGVY